MKTPLEQALDFLETANEIEMALFKAMQEKTDKEIIEAILKGEDE
jgi:hypothetical protein